MNDVSEAEGEEKTGHLPIASLTLCPRYFWRADMRTQLTTENWMKRSYINQAVTKDLTSSSKFSGSCVLTLQTLPGMDHQELDFFFLSPQFQAPEWSMRKTS